MFSRKRACGTGSGFTLIELLVVISVIAMLLAILMPSLGMIKEKGKSLVDRNQIRQLSLAAAIYTSEYSKKMPLDYGYTYEYWIRLLAPYVAEEDFAVNPDDRDGVMKLGICPKTKIQRDNGYGTATTTWMFNSNWAGGSSETVFGSYAINVWLMDDIYGYTDSAAVNPEQYVFPNYASAPAQTPLLADGFWVDTWPSDIVQEPSNYTDLVAPTYLAHQDRYFMHRVCVDRHQMAVNIGFVGGSAEEVKLKNLWSYRWNRAFKTTPEVDMPTN